MKKIILIINLIVKSIFEIFFVLIVCLGVGIFVFIVTYLYKTIINTITEYYHHINNS
jgi:uncharacterized membrane protein YvlD (DUF360 family)